MQGRGHVPALRLARGQAGTQVPRRGLRASGARGRPPPLSWGSGTEPGVELAKEGGTWTGQVGRASLLSASLTSSQTASSARLEPLGRGTAGACKREQVPSPTPVSQCGRRRSDGVQSAQQANKCRGRGRWRPELKDSMVLAYLPVGLALHLVLVPSTQSSRPLSAVAARQHLWLPRQPSPCLLPAPPCSRLGLHPAPHARPRRFRPASWQQVAPTPVRQGHSSGGFGTTALRPANQMYCTRVGQHLTRPLRNSA